MKILRSRKALSPVVASIILIAVTVAVSIAVAAWMGALSFSFMNNGEQVQLGSPYGWSNGGTLVQIRVSCPSGNAFSLAAARINNAGAAMAVAWANNASALAGPPYGPIPAQSSVIVNCTLASGTFQSGYSYTIVLTSSKNNEYRTTGMVP